MNILIAGNGKGSWEMRAIQIGAALGARVTTDPRPSDWGWADVAVLLKKTATDFAPSARLANVPIVWDVLDCWRQPSENTWSVENGLHHVAALCKQIRPAALIGATESMAHAINGTYIPHHSRIGLVPTPAREHVTVVAYDGSERYLGRWDEAVRIACAKRGWSFVINPPDLARVDLLIACRDNEWDGPICRAWKSGVKVVNAICAGRPIVTQRSDASEEFSALSPVIDEVESFADLGRVFDYWADADHRRAVADHCARIAPRYTVEAIAETYYRPLLARVLTEAPCRT